LLVLIAAGGRVDRFGNQVPDDVASKRLDMLQDLLEKQRMSFATSLQNKIVNVLFDNVNLSDPLQVSGRDEFMHLVIINCKNIEEKQQFLGKLIFIKIIKAEANVLIGEVVE
jgi:tRNA A37 methylthiotransferase MiaB